MRAESPLITVPEAVVIGVVIEEVGALEVFIEVAHPISVRVGGCDRGAELTLTIVGKAIAVLIYVEPSR